MRKTALSFLKCTFTNIPKIHFCRGPCALVYGYLVISYHPPSASSAEAKSCEDGGK